MARRDRFDVAYEESGFPRVIWLVQSSLIRYVHASFTCCGTVWSGLDPCVLLGERQSRLNSTGCLWPWWLESIDPCKCGRGWHIVWLDHSFIHIEFDRLSRMYAWMCACVHLIPLDWFGYRGGPFGECFPRMNLLRKAKRGFFFLSLLMDDGI